MPPSGRYMPSSSERYDIYLRGPVRPPLLFSGAPGQMRWASASGRCRTDSPIAGRVGEKHFFSRIGAIRFGTSRAFPARTRVTFPSPEKSPKGRTREGPFRWGPSLMNPTPATTQRGAHAPLWIPPHSLWSPSVIRETPERINGKILLLQVTENDMANIAGRSGLFFLRQKSDLLISGSRERDHNSFAGNS